MSTLKTLSLLFVLSISFGCQSPNAAQKNNKKESVAKNIKNTKQPKKSNKKTIANNKYFAELKTDLKLSDKKVTQLKKIKAEYSKKINAVPKTNKKERAALRKQREAQFRKILGPALYKKKRAFDKKRQTQKRKSKK